MRSGYEREEQRNDCEIQREGTHGILSSEAVAKFDRGRLTVLRLLPQIVWFQTRNSHVQKYSQHRSPLAVTAVSILPRLLRLRPSRDNNGHFDLSHGSREIPMKAAYITETGPPEVIQYGDLPDPTPQGREVLVRTGAVSINPIDTYIRNGADFWELPQPFIVGSDIAGTVEAVGSDASRFQVGDRVWGSNQGLVGRQGTFAELCAIDEEWLYPSPANIDDESLAAMALVGITAHLGLFSNARLEAGETVFVQGGSGGVGSTVVQMAKAAGARVIASAGSSEKATVCRALGADEVVLYREQNIAEAVRAFAPDGVNVFWETRREPDFLTNVDCLAERGRMVVMAGRDAQPKFPVGPFYVKGCQMIGFVMFKATPDEQRTSATAINQWFEGGQIKARIDRVIPLADAAMGHRAQEESTVQLSGGLAGKIVLIP